ncbi:hypothetical protein D6858_05670 [Tsuneonella suprasediminis]|uniref:TnsA endonuclease N-terminal domain-containing protein n=1 Tax=Tsuneonella suprasediminis TaxID=2306996 RepID=A0A419R3I3_9SPHN|nr:hypothetical protein [Tsuneonella suprasediminis]RJX68510.1 hypothetical protein D6858_05670 [Tsuneonella suprasediminis]
MTHIESCLEIIVRVLNNVMRDGETLGGTVVHKVVIVRAPDRDQLRGQITGKKSVRTICYPSKKMRRARFGEAAAEIERIEDEEVRTTVVDGVAQPLRVEALLETPTGMRWFVHIPDFATLLSNGDRVLLDAKRNWSDFRKDVGRRQTLLGQLAADALGYRYEQIVLGSAGNEIRRRNINEIQAYRFVHVPGHLVVRATSAVGRGPISLANLSELLHPVNGRSMAYALMVRRVVEIDLESPLGPRSECRSVPPLPLAMPSIRR